MRKGTPEDIAQKREEIINACEQLYQTMSFREITLKEIGKITSFSRPTIYNYFVTKEEIFLALFKREYDRWSLAERQQLLKLLSMNNYDMEANSRQEMLTIFKQSYGGSLHRMGLLLEKFCPDMEEADIQNFLYTFFPFMFGIYPYTAVTEKQKAAMKDAGINYVYLTVYDLAYSCLTRLLGN